MIVNLKAILVALVLGSSAAVMQVAADGGTIVDTGPGPELNGFAWGFDAASGQKLAAMFSVSNAVNVGSVELWMQGNGEFRAAIFSDDNGLPGVELFGSAYSVSNSNNSWYGVSGVSWNLAPGTYWAVFGAESGSGAATLPSNQPLDTAIWSGSAPYWQYAYLDFGVRIMDGAGIAGAIGVAIDVKPGAAPNCFNINGHGVIPVAILGSEDFDVTQIDLVSLTFGRLAVRMRGNKGPQCALEYSNDDSYLDLVCHFEDDADAWEPGNGEATLTGSLLDGSPFEGTDEICVVP